MSLTINLNNAGALEIHIPAIFDFGCEGNVNAKPLMENSVGLQDPLEVP